MPVSRHRESPKTPPTGIQTHPLLIRVSTKRHHRCPGTSYNVSPRTTNGSLKHPHTWSVSKHMTQRISNHHHGSPRTSRKSKDITHWNSNASFANKSLNKTSPQVSRDITQRESENDQWESKTSSHRWSFFETHHTTDFKSSPWTSRKSKDITIGIQTHRLILRVSTKHHHGVQNITRRESEDDRWESNTSSHRWSVSEHSGFIEYRGYIPWCFRRRVVRRCKDLTAYGHLFAELCVLTEFGKQN
jgi:hypothetical protein